MGIFYSCVGFHTLDDSKIAKILNFRRKCLDQGTCCTGDIWFCLKTEFKRGTFGT